MVVLCCYNVLMVNRRIVFKTGILRQHGLNEECDSEILS